MTTAINFEDDLQIEEGAWRSRITTALVLLLVGAAVAAAVWYFFLRDDSLTLTRETEEIPVARGTIAQRLSITGTADAELNSNLVFQTSGKVSEVNVKVGDKVAQGQVLASLESEDLQNAVAAAEANVTAAQLKVDDLLEGTDDAELAQAEQALASAQAAQTKARNDYDTLTGGGTAADLAAAEQGVTAAQAQLATARANRQALEDGASDADIALAEAGVAQAESALTAAENQNDSAAIALVAAGAKLKASQTSYCASDNTPSFCIVPVAPVASGDLNIVTAALGDIALAAKAALVIGDNAGYLSASNTQSSAAAAEQAAEQGLASAQAKLDAAQDGAADKDVAAADAAVTSAEASVRAAEEKLRLVRDGGTDAQRSSAAAAVVSADAAVDAAVAAFNRALRGADSNTLAQARQGVRTAQLQVEAARIRLKNARIEAPFDGTVGDVNIKVGEFSGGAAQAAEDGAPIVLLTPDRLTLSMSVGETDYKSLKVGQGGVAIFDGLPGAVYPFRISEIGLSPTVTQGVVTYPVKASIVVLPDTAPPVPGMNARGQITTSSVENVLIVPARAIRISGTNQVVDRKIDGGTEEVIVTTGATDGEQSEITSGLNEGDTIVVVTLTSGQSGKTPEARPTLPGGVR